MVEVLEPGGEEGEEMAEMEVEEEVQQEVQDAGTGRKRRGAELVNQKRKKQKTKEEKAAERKAKASMRKTWSEPLCDIDAGVQDFIVRHARESKRWIEATYV